MDQTKNKQTVDHANYALIDLKNAVNKKTVLEITIPEFSDKLIL